MKHFLHKSLLTIALLLGGVSYAWSATSYLTTWTGLVGTNDNAENFYYATKKVKIAAGETYVYTLTNYNNGNNDEPWKNWVVEGNLGSKYFDCEARGHKWQAGGANEPVYEAVIWPSDVTDWQTAYNGATVTITISRNAAGDEFTVTHTSNVLGTTEGNTSKYYGGTFTVSVGADEDWDIYITEENSHFLVTKVAYSHSSGGAIYSMPKMTYVNYNEPTTSYGEIAYGETARSGYNNISAGSVGFANSGWNVNYITYVNADASDVPDGATITNTSLSFAQSGSTDGKRVTCVGAGYNSSTWSNSMTYNTADKSITTVGDVVWTSTKSASLFESKSISILAAFSGDADNIVNILLYETEAAGCYIKNPELSVTYSIVAVYTATFTETNSLSPTVTIYSDSERTSEVTNGTLADGTTYYYRAVLDGYNNYDGSFTVSSEDPVVEFTMTAKPRYTFTVNAVNSVGGATIKAFYTDNDSYDGKMHRVYFPAYLTGVGNAVTYSKDNTTYYTEYVSSSADATKTQSYTAYDGYAWFFEGEELASKTGTFTQFASVMSNGSSGVLNDVDGNLVTSLESGVYTITVRTVGRGDGGRNIYVYKGSVDDSNKLLTATPSKSGNVESSSPFTLTETTNILVNNAPGGGENGRGLDYILIQKTAVTGTIPTSGFGSLASAYGLDFSSATVSSGTLTAYVVSSITTDAAKLTSVYEMPANSGVILEGKGGATYSIPVKVGATFGDNTNLLRAAVTATDITANQAYILQSGEFHLVTAASTIPAGKAYLLADDVPAEAKALRFVFDDTTAIRSIENGQLTVDNAEIYNLAGQRLNSIQRGVNIVNGKKILVK